MFEKGDLLIAKPSLLSDAVFSRVVILLADNNETGTVGFVLNKPLDLSLCDVIDAVSVDFTLYEGGPVEKNNLFYVHNRPDLIPQSVAITDTLFWGGDFEVVVALINNNTLKSNQIRFFLGYSGWDAGQLKVELKQDSWKIMQNLFPNILETSAATIWKHFMQKLGDRYVLWANAPSDPSLN